MEFNVLTTNAAELQQMLTKGALTSENAVDKYLDQIDRHNTNGMNLRALISVAPRELLLEQARQLDDERQRKKVRGPFHGIPIIIKDVIWTHPSLGMDTTLGTPALVGAKPPRNADLVQILIDAGLIILGKANLSELSLTKDSPPLVAGWSALGGQTQNPYVRGGVLPNALFLGHSTPGGSSSGSAVSVAAGFAPIAIGSETDGSIITPASRNALFSLKPTPGSVPMAGSQPIVGAFDVHGVMAKSAKDLADLTGIIMGGKDFSSYLTGSWEGLSVGILDPDVWKAANFVVEEVDSFTRQVHSELDKMEEKIKGAGGRVVRNVPMLTVPEISNEPGGAQTSDLFSYNVKAAFEAFLQSYETSPVRTLQELVDYHKAHADKCLPPEHPHQRRLEEFLTLKPMEDFEAKLGVVRRKALAVAHEAMSNHKLDALICPPDARIGSFSALAGISVGTLPLAFAEFNGRAIGLGIIAGPDGEGKILQVMSAWEKTFPEARVPPPQLLQHSHL